jgi:hypothetical protein
MKWWKRGLAAGALAGGFGLVCSGFAHAEGGYTEDGKYLLPASGSVTVPVTARANAIGTPLGQLNLPEISTQVSTAPAMHAVQPLYDNLYMASMPLHPPWPTPDHPDGGHVGGFFHLDHTQANAVIPVNISGNAIAAGGDATVGAVQANSVAAAPSPAAGSGYHGLVSGNMEAVDAALPIAITGNAVGIKGNALTAANSTTAASSGGALHTEGANAFGSGNALALPVAAPVHLSGNKAGLLGETQSTGSNQVSASASGPVTSTKGTDPLSGNVINPNIPIDIGLVGKSLTPQK